MTAYGKASVFAKAVSWNGTVEQIGYATGLLGEGQRRQKGQTPRQLYLAHSHAELCLARSLELKNLGNRV